jgi:hypothetical protein
MGIQAYESNGTTIVNIDNITFTNVALVGNKIEFTTTTGDKYINMATDPNPVASAGSYYNIKRYNNISDANNDSLTSFTATYSGSVNNLINGAFITLAPDVNNVLIAATSYYYGATVNVDGIIGTGYSSRTIYVPTGTIKNVFVTVTPANGVTKEYRVTFVADDETTPAITSFEIEGISISSSNGIDYYYNNIYNISPAIADIKTSNASSISFTHDYYPITLTSPIYIYDNRTYEFEAPIYELKSSKYTITLSSNGVDKTYYLYVKGSDATSYV